MKLSEQSDHDLHWTDSEKKAARRAFGKALERRCAAIAAEVKRMLGNAKAPPDIWQIHDYLSENRRSVDRIFDYRYSRLPVVFSILMRDGWLTIGDLAGLEQEKIDRIKRGAKL